MTALSAAKDALLLYVFVYVHLTPAGSGPSQCRLPVSLINLPNILSTIQPKEPSLSESGSNRVFGLFVL